MLEDITHNLSIIHQRIESACKQSNRNTSDVRLQLATKTVSEENLRFAINQGETLLGENKVLDGLKMAEAINDLHPEWHFIGHLQTNKVKEVVKWATCIQSIDRADLVEKLDQRLQFEGKAIDIYLQINTSYEESKFGVAPEHAIELAKTIQKYDTLNLKGLMTIGLFSDDQTKIRNCFKLLKSLQKQVYDLGFENAHELSMGMSEDLEIAIEEGATIVRVGTAIFGPRVYAPKS